MADVSIAYLSGHDFTLPGRNGAPPERLRTDSFVVTLDGREYRATCGAVWDRAENNGWGLDYLYRKDMRRGRKGTWETGLNREVWVRVSPRQTAWHLVSDALHAHRMEHGYARRPEPREKVADGT